MASWLSLRVHRLASGKVDQGLSPLGANQFYSAIGVENYLRSMHSRIASRVANKQN